MRLAKLSRMETSDHGTFGILRSGEFAVYISELPWRNNLKQKSCIPEGLYEVKWHKSPKFGWTYKVFGVQDRAEILIHSGNYAGNTDLQLLSNSHGCLLPALKLGKIKGQKAGLMSVPAVKKLVDYFGKEPFLLEIKNAYNSAVTSE